MQLGRRFGPLFNCDDPQACRFSDTTGRRDGLGRRSFRQRVSTRGERLNLDRPGPFPRWPVLVVSLRG